MDWFLYDNGLRHEKSLRLLASQLYSLKNDRNNWKYTLFYKELFYKQRQAEIGEKLSKS